MAVIPNGPVSAGFGVNLARTLQISGAALSVGLVIAAGVWGYRLAVRDATGIPVVRAIEGPMRVAHEQPGGIVAEHADLSVNEIAAMGAAAPTSDVLRIAPQTAGLAAEDMEIALSPEAGEVMAADLAEGQAPDAVITPAAAVVPAPDQPMSAEDILALADQIAAGVAPLDPAGATAAVPPVLTVAGAALAEPVVILPPEVPGLARAMVPPARPSGFGGIAALADPAAPVEIAPSAPLAPGTPFGQLGVFSTTAEAAAAWDQLVARHGALLQPTTRVIAQAESGGVPFFRLRATGFADLAEAQRLCVALIAEGATCVASAAE